MSEQRRALTVAHRYADVICTNCSIGNSVVDDGDDWQCGNCGAPLGKPERFVPPPPQTVTPDEDAEWLLRIAESKAGERVQFSRQAAARLSRIAARLRSPSDAR